MFCWKILGPAILVDVTLTRTTYLSIVADYVYPFMETVFPDGCGLFQQDNASCHKTKMVQEWFDEHNNEFEMSTFPSNSTVLDLIEHLWVALDKPVRIMEAPHRNLQDLKDLLLTSWCQIPQHTFRDIEESMPHQKTGPNSMDTSMSQPDPLRDLVAALRQVLATHPAPAPTPPATTSVNTITTPSTLLCASPMAKPAPYSGSAEDCNGFLLQCSLVLEMQPHLYPTERSKVAFIITQLSGKALLWAESLWSLNHPAAQSYSGFIDHFKEVFGKPSWDSSIEHWPLRVAGTSKRSSPLNVKDWIHK
ncbi:hypothetical protein QTP70_008852 [Hemibagrus guttatus]|uniref:DUF4939 domain-containing protein n=1 Tax=Hemibagrus guttatus TaxID=175788 RepID=A0AAE0V315_9TELE|nr:hypothetical protein QTP70_008852 [Hemibagrus guttatus]